MTESKSKHVVELKDDLLKRARIALRLEAGEPIAEVIEAAFERIIAEEIRKHFEYLADPNNGIDRSLLDDDG